MAVQRKRTSALIAALTTLVVVGSYHLFWLPSQHMKWYRKVECLIVELADHRPPDLSPSQWACCLHQTWNLHGNYGNSAYWDIRQRDAFEAEFRKRIQDTVDLSLIDWVWDTYEKGAPQSVRYDQYRPTQGDWLKDANQEGADQTYDLNAWLLRRGSGPCAEAR